MRKVIAVLMIVSVLALSGCADGPIRRFWRGAACYWCGTGPTSSVAPCDNCTTTQGHTAYSPAYAPTYEVPMPGVESLPSPGQIGPAK